MDFPVTEEFVQTANAAQLHDDARGDSPEWPASFCFVVDQWVYRIDDCHEYPEAQDDGTVTMRAEHRDDVVIDADRVQGAIKNHAPQPSAQQVDDARVAEIVGRGADASHDELAEALALMAKRAGLVE